MRKRVLSFVLSAALIANSFLSVQTAKAETNTNTSTIPVQLVKKEGAGGEESGDYNPSSKGKIESIDIKKKDDSHYLDKAYYQTELDGKAVKSLQWLDAGQGLIKYELANEPTLPQNVDLYYDKTEQTAKANYYFTGGKADVGFTLSAGTSDRVDVVNENGVALTNEEVYIADDKTEEQYTFLVQTKTEKRDTKITVKMQEDGAGATEVPPSDNLSTVSQITLKYVVNVTKGKKYTFTVEGVENNGTPSFTLEQMECTKPEKSDPGNWYNLKSGDSAPSITKAGNKMIDQAKGAVISELRTISNDTIEAKFTLNTYDCVYSSEYYTYNYLVDCIAIADEFVQVPAPPMAYSHTASGKDAHWNKMKEFINSPENKPVITEFTTGKLAGSTVEVKITDLVVANDTNAINAVGLVYTVTMKKPPKEAIPINIRTRSMSQGYIAKASTRGIADLELYCNASGIWKGFGANDKEGWQPWVEPADKNVHWISLLAKSIKGNIHNDARSYDMRNRDDMSDLFKEDVNTDEITRSDQKFRVHFSVEDGYVNPKVVYDHQELNIRENKPVSIQESYIGDKIIQTSTNIHEVSGLTVPRYGIECNTETTDTDGTKVFVGNLSSLLFQVELLELPIELDEQNGTDVKQVGTMNVQSRKTLQIPDAIPRKDGSYFTGYKLCKVAGDSEFPSSKYYYPGQTITLKDDVGTFAVNGKKYIDKVVLKAVYGEVNTDTANKVVVKTILKKLNGPDEVYDQKVFSAAKDTYVRVNNVVEKITKGSEFKFSETDTTSMTRVGATSVTRAGDVTTNSGFSLDGKVTADGQVFEIVYMEEEGQKLELFKAGTTESIPDNKVVAGSEVKVNLTLKKTDNMPETIQVKVPGKDELVTLTKKAGSDNDEKVVYEADNILVTKAETGMVTISDEDKANIQEVEKITNPPLTVVAGEPSSQTSTIKVSPSAITVTGSSVGTVVLKDAYGNPIKGANPIVKVDGQDLPATSPIKDNGDGTYEFRYTPDSVGNKLFELMGDNNQVVGNDTLTVESGAGTGEAGTGEAGTGETGTGGGTNTDGEKPEEVIPTKPVGTIIVMKDGQQISDILAKDEMEIVVELKSTEPLPEELAITVPGVEGDVILKRDSTDGLYKAKVIPTKPMIGHITINDSRYEHQPVQITVYVGEISTENSNFAFEADSLTVGENISGKLRLQDKNGNGISNKQPRITFDGDEVENKELEEEVGTYAFNITPRGEGHKVLTAEVDGKEVVKYTIQVIPPSFPNRGNHSIPFFDTVEDKLVENEKENKVETEKTVEDDKKNEEFSEKESDLKIPHKTSNKKKKELNSTNKVISISQGIAGTQSENKKENIYLIGKEEKDNKGNGKQESYDTGIVFGNYFVSPTSSITSTNAISSSIPKTDDYIAPKTFLILLSSMMVMIFQVRRKIQR